MDWAFGFDKDMQVMQLLVERCADVMEHIYDAFTDVRI